MKNRVDPSRQSVSNPVPDYYCEKVGNLKQYRQWSVLVSLIYTLTALLILMLSFASSSRRLRDQSAYKRKSTFGSDKDVGL